MKKSGNYVIILSVVLIIIGIASSLFFSEYSSTISTIVSTATALIGAIAIFIQFREDKIINKAGFVMEISNSFYKVYACEKLFVALDTLEEKGKYDFNDNKWRIDINNYLTWCKTLASLIEDNVISIKDIDKLFYYRFFILTNNKVIQKKELVAYKQYYTDIFSLHTKWSNYRKSHNLEIPFDDESLDKFKDN